MEVYSTEQEQIAQLKRWLKSYGPPVILGIIIALAAGFGWRYWHAYKIRRGDTASVAYVNMIGATLDHLDKEAAQFAQTLRTKYSSTPYAKFASLLLAKQAVDKGRYSEAATRLTWVMNNADNKSIKQVAKIRLATVLLAQKKPKLALNALKTVNNKTYIGLVNETRGDAYLALQKTQQAKKAYHAAQMALPPSAAGIIEMKLANIE